MSKEWIFRTLLNQGLQQIDAQIYVLLTMEGPKSRKSIAHSLNSSMYEISHSLSHLKSIGIISEIPKRSVLFSALSFDKVLGLFLETKKAQTKDLQESRGRLISSWEALLDDNE
jgi:hypothetical protein